MSDPFLPPVFPVPAPRATLDGTQTFIEELETAHETGATRYVLDFSGVTFVDSSFLGAMVQALKRADAEGGDIALCNVGPEVRAVLDISRIAKLFTMHDNVESARDALQKGQQ